MYSYHTLGKHYLIEQNNKNEGIIVNATRIGSMKDLKNSFSAHKFLEETNIENAQLKYNPFDKNSRLNEKQNREIPKLQERLKYLNW